MKLSIIIPCYNEISTIDAIIQQVRAVSLPIEREIVIVDDFSTDGTRDFLKTLDDPAVKVFFHDENQGKGAALHTGFANATGDIVLIQDADLEYDPREYPKLLQPILEGKADVVYGSRFLQDFDSPAVHKFANKFLTRLSNIFTGLHLTDMETCQKVIRREYLDGVRIRSNRFGIEPEITAKLAREKPRLIELPISYKFRNYEEGKKIGWWDGIKACFAIIYFRFFD